MTNNKGRVIAGTFTPDRLAWKPGILSGKTYTFTAAALDDDGDRTGLNSTFSTVQPGNLTKSTFVTARGNLLIDGGTFGVGIVVVTPLIDK